MTEPSRIAPIQAPARPVAPGPPFIASLPQAASDVPTDAELLRQLRAMAGTPQAAPAKAFIQAYAAFGNRTLLVERIPVALIAADLPGEGLKPFLIHIARLSAEAFVFDVGIDGDKQFHLGFIEDPAHIAQGQPSQQEQFLHFSMRRLLDMASSSLTPDQQRLQMDKAIALFAFLQSELGREFRLTIASESVLLAYRQLLFKIVQKHYQTLMDGLMAKAASGSKAQYSDALKQMGDHWRATMVLDLSDEKAPKVPQYLIKGDLFRDYFGPDAKTDFRFKFYSRQAPPIADDGPEITFRSVLRKREEQLVILDDLRAGPHPAARPPYPAPTPSPSDIRWRQSGDVRAQPEAPKLHDNQSWQQWVRRMWESADLRKPPADRLASICSFVRRYFNAFTVHVPYDLAETCRETNYLLRPYPRAITGCLTHDCLVYAIRWIYILGRLLAPGSMPRELSAPRLSLVEMPSHIGVMIRLRTLLSGDVLIGTNNQEFFVEPIDADFADSAATEMVVTEMYPGLEVPSVQRKLKSSPTDATALWSEICKLSERKLRLPYDDPAEPFLNYLRFNAEDARIGQTLGQQVGELWRATKPKLDPPKQPGKPRSSRKQELKLYHDQVEKLFVAALAEFDKTVPPIATAIKTDVEAHLAQKPKDAAVITTETDALAGWRHAIAFYRLKLQHAEESPDLSTVDLSTLDPEDMFPEDGFPPGIQ